MFDILGHLDYIRSRASGLLAPQALDLRLPLMAELAQQAARAGLVLEVNVADSAKVARRATSAGKADRVAVRTRETVRAYLEAGGPGITVGTDSQHLEQFEGGWERTRAYLEEAGVREVTLFCGRQRRVVAL